MSIFRTAALLLALGLSVAACQKQEAPTNKETSASDPRGIHRDQAGKPAPDVELSDAEDEPATLADAKGQPVLVNIWATWCAPCVKELPTLQAVAKQKGGIRVIAVSQDVAPRGSVDAFLEKNRLTDLEVWHDPRMALSSASGAEILPTTILYDAQGREVWRYVGDLDWSGEEARKLLAELPAAGRG
jgi:thiol-disulfide isomerase/thioredoxin